MFNQFETETSLPEATENMTLGNCSPLFSRKVPKKAQPTKQTQKMRQICESERFYHAN